jgi:hypothetical protein
VEIFDPSVGGKALGAGMATLDVAPTSLLNTTTNKKRMRPSMNSAPALFSADCQGAEPRR